MAKANTPIMLGRTGLQVCRMGMGGIPIQRLSLRASDRLLERAVEMGINFFDSARVYTDSELKLGRVLSRHRGQVVIASKTLSRDAGQVERDIETSLRQLQTDCIDIYQCHNVASEAELDRVLAPGGALSAMVKAQERGKIRHIGLSGHKPWIVLKALQAFAFATIQVPFNHIESAAAEELLPHARRQHIGTIAMKPIGGGNIREIALNFRFIFSSGIEVAIPGMNSLTQIRRNLAALQHLTPLTASERKHLEREKERLGENFCRRCEYCMPCPQGLPIAFLHVLKNYYFLYELKDWVWERLNALNKSFKDCVACRSCVEKCPYHLDSPDIFKKTWETMQQDRDS